MTDHLHTPAARAALTNTRARIGRRDQPLTASIPVSQEKTHDRHPGGRPCSVCSHAERSAIEATAREASQAEACRRYGIAKGSMSRHMSNHAAASDLVSDASGHFVDAENSGCLPKIERSETTQASLRTGPYQAKGRPDSTQEPAKAIPPPPMIERSETAEVSDGDLGPLRAATEQWRAGQTDPALNAEQTHPQPIEAAPIPQITHYPATSFMKHSLPIGARCKQCGGSLWWRRSVDGFTGCMTCHRIGGSFLPPGLTTIAT